MPIEPAITLRGLGLHITHGHCFSLLLIVLVLILREISLAECPFGCAHVLNLIDIFCGLTICLFLSSLNENQLITVTYISADCTLGISVLRKQNPWYHCLVQFLGNNLCSL